MQPTWGVYLVRILLLLIGQLSGQQTFASHWLEEFSNSTPACLIIDQSYADGHQQHAS
jgi:hypothetical protein